MVNKYKVVLFGGATGDTGKYSMTGETFIFNMFLKTWTELTGKYNSLNFSRFKLIFYSKISERSSSFTKSSACLNKCRTNADGRVWWSHWGW